MLLNNISIRDALPKDSSLINLILEKSWLATYVPLGVSEKAIKSLFFDKKDREIKTINYLENINHETDIGLVMEVNKELVGLCFGLKNNDYFLLTQIYIHPNYIGNQLGTKLISAFIDKTGSFPIKVSVYEKNIYAIDFYIRNGFKIVNEKIIFKLNEDIHLNEVVLMRDAVVQN